MRKRAGLLAGLLVVVQAIGVVAQEPSPPPWPGGRIVMPEHGFAVTLPDDWVGFDTAAATPSQIDAAFAILDPAVWSIDEVEATWMEGFAKLVTEGVPLWAAHASSSGACELGRSLHPPFAEVADDHLQWYLDDPMKRDVEPRLVAVRDVTAYHISMAYRDEPDSDEWFPASAYLLDGDGVVLEAYCHTHGARPNDDWLSIVETFEFPPAEE